MKYAVQQKYQLLLSNDFLSLTNLNYKTQPTYFIFRRNSIFMKRKASKEDSAFYKCLVDIYSEWVCMLPVSGCASEIERSIVKK
jgi:hypothetical protein